MLPICTRVSLSLVRSRCLSFSLSDSLSPAPSASASLFALAAGKLGYLKSGKAKIMVVDTFHLFDDTMPFLASLEKKYEFKAEVFTVMCCFGNRFATCRRSHTSTYTHTHAQIHMSIHTQTHTYTYTHTNTITHNHTHTRNTHTHTHNTHTHKHKHTHTYTHT